MERDQQGTVLVVDDTEDSLIAAVQVLRAADVRCLTASHGRQCLEITRREVVDLILLDLIMPRMDGWVTLAALRDDQATRHIPVVMFTRDDRLVTRLRAMKEGVVDFLPRPVTPERLLACVRTHLNAVARARALEATGRRLEAALSPLDA